MLTDINPPPTEPVTLSEAKLFLRVDHDDEDSLIQTLIASARERLESYLGVAMIARPLRIEAGATGCLVLPRWPVVSVDVVMVDGEASTDYHADLRKRPSTVTVTARDSIAVDFMAGYGTEPADIPAPLRQALLLLVAQGYEAPRDGADTLPLIVDALTLPYKVLAL